MSITIWPSFRRSRPWSTKTQVSWSPMARWINAAATEDNFVLAFGNFDNYVIADRVGMSIEFIPHLFGGNQRPTGQRGWYAYYRVGANVVDPGAFKVLNVATTA